MANFMYFNFSVHLMRRIMPACDRWVRDLNEPIERNAKGHGN